MALKLLHHQEQPLIKLTINPVRNEQLISKHLKFEQLYR